MLKKVIRFLILIIILAAIGFGVYLYIQHKDRYPSTDDAYVNGHIVNISSQVNAKVTSIDVHNHQKVTKDQLLFTLDPKPFEIALQKAQAELKSTKQTVASLKSDLTAAMALISQRKAELVNTRKNTQRILNLTKQHLYPQANKDNAISQLKVAEAALTAAKAQYASAQANLGEFGNENAKIRTAKAALAQAKLELSYTQVRAPNSGTINKLTLRQGDSVTAYQPLFALVGDQHWWVNANFKETQLQRIRVGQNATIILDMYPDHAFHGKVISISSGSGAAFALLPAENATGNWVKVTQRFPVWIQIQATPSFPLRIGASANVTINTTHDQHAK